MNLTMSEKKNLDFTEHRIVRTSVPFSISLVAAQAHSPFVSIFYSFACSVETTTVSILLPQPSAADNSRGNNIETIESSQGQANQ